MKRVRREKTKSGLYGREIEQSGTGIKIRPEADGKFLREEAQGMSTGTETLALLALWQAPTGGGGYLTFLPLVVIMGIFYVMMLRPQQRRQKKTREMLATLKSGDKVLTTSGIYGTIAGLEENAIQLRITDQVKIKMLRSAIAEKLPESKES